MFDNMGIQSAGTLLGCVAIVLVPIPIYFWFFGTRKVEKSVCTGFEIKPASSDEIHTEVPQEAGAEEGGH